MTTSYIYFMSIFYLLYGDFCTDELSLTPTSLTEHPHPQFVVNMNWTSYVSLPSYGKASYVSKSSFASFREANRLIKLSGDINPNPGPTIPLPSTFDADDDMFQQFSRRGLNFIHLNTTSLFPKLSEIKLIANRTKSRSSSYMHL